MLVPTNRAARDLHPLPNRIINRLVRDNDVPSLGECRNDTRNRRERLRVDDARRGAQKRRDVRLDLHVHVLRAVESGGSTWSNSVRTQCLNGALLEVLVRVEVVEIIGCKICHRSAVGQFRSRTAWSLSQREKLLYITKRENTHGWRPEGEVNSPNNDGPFF